MRRISFGGGYNYLKHTVNIKDYSYLNNGTTITQDEKYIVNTNSLFFRVNYHFLELFEESNEMIDLYIGGEHQYIFWKSFHTSSDPNFPELDEEIYNFPAIFIGLRFYPTEYFGLFVESAFPGAYTASGGVSIRIGGRDKFLK